jgi:hypothetical protein
MTVGGSPWVSSTDWHRLIVCYPSTAADGALPTLVVVVNKTEWHTTNTELLVIIFADIKQGCFS